MSENKKSYDPSSVIERYNIDAYLYDNKNTIYGVTIFSIVLLFILGIFLFWNGLSNPQQPNIGASYVPNSGNPILGTESRGYYTFNPQI